MELSDALATAALIISIASAWLSYKAHRESTLFTEREAQREFSRERSEFLIRIERSIKMFEHVEARIRAILASIDGERASVQSSMREVAQQLKGDLDYLQGCLRQARSLWDENFEMSHDGFAHHKPRHLALLESDESFAQEAMDRADKAAESLKMAVFLSTPIVG